MQSLELRKQLIAEGRYVELEHPADAHSNLPVSASPATQLFRTTVSEVFECEPGQEG